MNQTSALFQLAGREPVEGAEGSGFYLTMSRQAIPHHDHTNLLNS